MEQDFIEQLNRWNEEEKYKEIVKAVQAVDESERSFELRGHLARALNNLERYQEALDLLDQDPEQGKDDVLWLFRRGYACFYLDRFEESAQAFGRVVELDETDEDSWIMLARSQKHIGDQEGYERSGERLKALNPRRWRSWFGDRSNKIKVGGKLSTVNRPIRIDEETE